MSKSVKATLLETREFLLGAEIYMRINKKERSKLTFALTKQSQKYQKKVEKLMRERNDEEAIIRNKHASTDDKGNVIEEKVDVKDGSKGGVEDTVMRYRYTQKAKKDMTAELAKLDEEYESKEIEVEPPYKNDPKYLEIPEGMEARFYEPFKKFIFNPELSEEEELKAYLSGADDANPRENGQSPTIKSVLKKSVKD